jgi:transcriptional regulator of nitric oxide reductase
VRAIIVAMIWMLGLSLSAPAETAQEQTGALVRRLTPEVLETIFPGATRVAALNDGGPTAAEVYAGTEVVGYAFSTLDILRAPGYSSTPFDVVAGVTLSGRLTGAAVLFHREPYLLDDARRTGQLVQFLGSLDGVEGKMGAQGGLAPDFVAGATISARAMRNAVLESASIVVGFRQDFRVVTEPTVDQWNFRPMDADQLIASGALARVVVTNADLEAAMEHAGVAGLPLEVAPKGGPDDIYLDLRMGYGMVPTIGRNSAGQAAYGRIRDAFPEGSQALVFGSYGAYDYRGTKFNNISSRFLLERLSVVQGDRVFEFHKPDLIHASFEIGTIASVLMLPPDSGFDPLQPWRVDIRAFARKPTGGLVPFPLTSLDYRLPPEFILFPATSTAPAWVEPWIEGRWNIAVLVAALAVLTLILGFQDRLSRSRRAHRWIRTGFLTFTLIWIGWIAGAQLSIVHLLNYLQAPFRGLGFGYYLAEPLIVLVSVYTLLSLILLGRGVFCGWLCPFGALQELLSRIARILRLPQWNPKEGVQRVLWNGKYVALAVIVTLVFLAPDAAVWAEEIEPFKTAITAMFARGWIYVLWAVILLSVGLFTERAFCRYLCPLGGALAVLDRLHVLELLKRRPECGNPCSLCERSCPVKAIERSGKIRMAECFQCLDCQVEYYDDRRCPPLAQIRKSRERAAKTVPFRLPAAGLPAGAAE